MGDLSSSGFKDASGRVSKSYGELAVGDFCESSEIEKDTKVRSYDFKYRTFTRFVSCLCAGYLFSNSLSFTMVRLSF